MHKAQFTANRLFKIPYLIYSGAVLAYNIRKIYVEEGKMKIGLKNNLVFTFTSLLELLIIKETVIDDCYGIKRLENPQVIIDIGAAAGEFSIFAASLYPHAQILAIEPDPLLVERIRENCILNRSSQIQILNIGAGGGDSQCMLNLQKNSSQNTFIQSANLSSQSQIPIEVRSLDTLLAAYKTVDFLKIDCEGCEDGALSCASTHTLAKIREISLEYHEFAVPGVAKKLSDLLLKDGFKVTLVPNTYDPSIGFVFARKL